MSEVTLEAIQARQTELAEMIAKLSKPANATRTLDYPEVSIELREGDHFAGAVLNADGTVKHHLILLGDKPDGEMPWAGAKAWAGSVGGSLPDRQEAALLFANCKTHLEGVWHWTSEEYESNRDYAWICNFYDGSQYGNRKDTGYAARAVRRF